jgi:hypothetical protein
MKLSTIHLINRTFVNDHRAFEVYADKSAVAGTGKTIPFVEADVQNAINRMAVPDGEKPTIAVMDN